MVERAGFRSYYGRPVLKPHVWRPEVPWYFFAGGLTGASAALSVAAGVAGNRTLARRAWLVTLAAGTASPALLIADLGRPERFLNMLRVFKITSPMSVGAWVVAATGSSVGLATASEALGTLPRVGRAARAASGLLGLPMATYTAALVANTAVPAWHEARRELPFLFAASAAASAGAAAAAVTPAPDAGPARRLAAGGAAVELAVAGLMKRRLGELAEPYRNGRAGRLARAAGALSAAGALLLGVRGGKRPFAIGGAAALLAGSLLERWAVFEAGHASASDPRYTVAPQRARLRSLAPARDRDDAKATPAPEGPGLRG
jgi:hypothetical protein